MDFIQKITNRSPQPPPDQPELIADASFILLDTELTGLDAKRDSIISFGAVRMKGSRIDVNSLYKRMINPEAEFSPESVVVHGILPSEVSQEPLITEVLSEFTDYCRNDILVGYCIEIDMAFIRRDVKRLFGRQVDNPVIEIVRVYEWLRRVAEEKQRDKEYPPIGRDGLYGLADVFDIEVSVAHNAAMDAFISAQVFQRLLHGVAKEGITRVEQLLKIEEPANGGTDCLPASNFSNF